jgi:hypothetical protein
MNIFALETRKKYTNLIIDTISSSILAVINNNFIAGNLFVFCHMNAITYMLYKLISAEVGSIYYFYTIIWIIVIYSNYYFHGCILARIEQKIFQDKTWAGPVNIILFPLHLFYKPNKQVMNEYIKYFWCAPISTAIICKYLLKDSIVNKCIGLMLMTIFTPLLFIFSQSDTIFDHINKYYNSGPDVY